MNIENINKTIAIMKRAQRYDSVSMMEFQDGAFSETLATSENELHVCGNKACLAGHIAISPEWLSVPGRGMNEIGAPSDSNIPEYTDPIANWWGVSNDTVEYFVIGLGTMDNPEYGIYGVDWHKVKAEHVIEQLTLLRDLGEVEYRLLKKVI